MILGIDNAVKFVRDECHAGTNRKFIETAIEVGTLPATRSGKSWQFKESDVRFWVSQGMLRSRAETLTQAEVKRLLNDRDRWKTYLEDWKISPVGRSPETEEALYPAEDVHKLARAMGGKLVVPVSFRDPLVPPDCGRSYGYLVDGVPDFPSPELMNDLRIHEHESFYEYNENQEEPTQ